MHSRLLRSFAAFATASLMMFGTASMADAAGKDDAAKKSIDAALDDYLNTKFDAAVKKLNNALKACGSGCSAETIGKLHVTLGTIYGAGQSKMDDATSEFQAAIKADPNAKLDPSLANDELKKAFAAAKKGGGKSNSGDSGDEGDDDSKPKKPHKAPGGDLTLDPPKEGQVNTPLALKIDIPEDLGAQKVTLHYKAFGASEFKTVDMKKMGKAWGALVPCEEVSTTGDLKFYIVAKDESGDSAGDAGSKKAPYTVTIKNEVDEVPALPGQDPPKQCKAREDCPPGLPGCPNSGGGGASGSDTAPLGVACETKSDCQTGEECTDGHCKGPDSGGSNGKAKRNLMTLTVGLDVLSISGADNVCSGSNVTGNSNYACFYQSGSSSGSGQFYGAPTSHSGTNGIQGGFAVGGGRILVSYDRQIGHGGFELGLRAGYAFGGSPSSDADPTNNHAPTSSENPSKAHTKASSFMPVHAEARATYRFGGDGVMEEKKFKPYLFIGGGLAQVNASVPVDVCDQLDAHQSVIAAGAGSKNCAKASNPNSRAITVDAYQITGLNFVGVGAGGVFGITPSFGIAAELKFMFMVPTFGVVFAPSIGPAFAF